MPAAAVSGIVERRAHAADPVQCSARAKDGQPLRHWPPTSRCRSPRTANSPGKLGTQAITVAARKLQRPCCAARTTHDDGSGNNALTRMTVRGECARVSTADPTAGGLSARQSRAGKATTGAIAAACRRRVSAACSKAWRNSRRPQQDIRATTSTGCCLVVDNGSLQTAVATDGHRRCCRARAPGWCLESYARQEAIPALAKTVLELGKSLEDSDSELTIDLLANQVRFRFANIRVSEQKWSTAISGLQPASSRRDTPSRSDCRASSCCRRCSGPRSCRTRNFAACARGARQ